MAKSKKAAPKKTASKKVVAKKAPPQKGKAKKAGPKKGKAKFMDVVFDAAVANNFSYTFEKSNCTILKLVVERFESDKPPDSGEFYTPILDPNNPPKVRVMVDASQDLPVANGRLTIKYNTKDVFSPTEEIIFSGGIGSINTLVKLPA